MQKILVVDDNKDFAELLADLLGAHDYDVTLKYDGLQAINHIKDGHEYDLVITDIIMPHNDGFDLIDVVKEHTQSKVMAVSGGGVLMSSKDVIESLAEKADACLEKPVNMSELLDAVSGVLEH